MGKRVFSRRQRGKDLGGAKAFSATEGRGRRGCDSRSFTKENKKKRKKKKKKKKKEKDKEKKKKKKKKKKERRKFCKKFAERGGEPARNTKNSVAETIVGRSESCAIEGACRGCTLLRRKKGENIWKKDSAIGWKGEKKRPSIADGESPFEGEACCLGKLAVSVGRGRNSSRESPT